MEEALRESLRALAWARYAPLVEHYAAIRAMSDEEYLSTLPPTEHPETRAERLMQRDRWALDETQLRAVAREEVDRILPAVIEFRKASGATGPATLLEYHQAVMATSSFNVRQISEMMSAKAAGMDPRRAEILAALTQAAEEEAIDFSADPSQGVTDRGLGRMHSPNNRFLGLNPN